MQANRTLKTFCLMSKIKSTRWISLILLLWAGAVSFNIGSAQDTTPEITTTPVPRPAPTQVLTSEEGFTLELFFDSIPQGGIGLLHVTGAGLTDARARFYNKVTEFFPIDGDGFYGLISTGMERSPRMYELSVFVSFEDGSGGSLTTQVEVVSGQFIRQDFAISPDRAYLIDPQVERDEFARLESIYAAFTPEHLWDEHPFALPVDGELTSPFGAFRTLNETVQTRHTGWDQRAVMGTPVMAAASGRIAFAGVMDIRGNYVLIDHGYGIYSGYAHLSQIHVTRGQSVASGQIIGVSGDTGRGNGPHMHWEMVANGEWIDGLQFVDMWLP